MCLGLMRVEDCMAESETGSMIQPFHLTNG